MAKTNTKPTGRPKGSKNKLSSENKGLLEELLNGYLESETLAGDISMLSAKERGDFMLKVHSLTAPKVTQSELDMTIKHPYIGNQISLTDEERIELGIEINDNDDE